MIRIVNQGACGTCGWTLNARGILKIFPADGKRGFLGMRENFSWKRHNEDVSEIIVEEAVYVDKDAKELFADMPKLEKADLCGLDLSRTEDISGMFRGCVNLRKIKGLEKTNAENLVKADEAFAGCGSLENIEGIECWDIGNLKSAKRMFFGCASLKKLDLSEWEANDSVDFADIFGMCKSPENIDISTWKTKKKVKK